MPLPASRSPSPGDGAAAPGSGANFTALLAARKFRANAMSEEKREERRAAGAKLRAELPPGPLPDNTPPSTSKLLARLMSRDGMTPGDRARKQARLREMQVALAAKENVSPDVGKEPSSPNPTTNFRASLFRRFFFLNFSLNARLLTAVWSPVGEATWNASRRASAMSRETARRARREL